MTQPRTAQPILVVDDDEGIRQLLSDYLRDEGHQVTTAADGRDALDQLQAGLRPALIILDLMMPRLDGWEFLRLRKTDPALSGTPILVFSAASDIGGSFAVPFVVKGEPIRHLLLAVQSMLGA